MIERLEISGVHTKVDPALRRYVSKKIGGLDKYIPRHSRKSAHMEVFIKDLKLKKQNTAQCEVKLVLPHQTILIKENAINFYAAVDIVEAKLKLQLKKYKDLHDSGKLHRHLVGRFRLKG